MGDKDRVMGALIGLAVGDALGVPVEFTTRDAFVPVTGMRSGGPHHTRAGDWSDDTSMALCLADSLLADDLDVRSQMDHYCRWRFENEWTSNGKVFDVGNHTNRALSAYQGIGRIGYQSGHNSAGNGSIMRLAPVPMFCHGKTQRIAQIYAEVSSMTTHPDERCLSASSWMSAWMWRAMNGASLQDLIAGGDLGVRCLEVLVAKIAGGAYLHLPRERVNSGGYVIFTLEAALWCIARHTNFRDTVLEAVNLGDDADTVGAVAGQMAGALYGLSAIPTEWVNALARSDELLVMAGKLYEAGQ